MTVQSVLRVVLKLVLCGMLFFPMFAPGGMLAKALGIALFLCVGLLGMLVAFWMPVYVRVPHTAKPRLAGRGSTA